MRWVHWLVISCFVFCCSVQADVNALQHRLSRLEFKLPDHDEHVVFRFHSPPVSAGFGHDVKGDQALRAQVQLLKGLRLTLALTQSATVDLHYHSPYTSVTEAVMDALCDLPAWKAALDIGRCKWPLPCKRYERLAECIPVTYSEWIVTLTPHTSLFNSICSGVERRREGLCLPPLKITLRGYYGSVLRVGEHVVVSKPAWCH